MDQKILENAKSWSENSYFSEEDRKEILHLLSDINKHETEITERFYKNLEFGTGGLRAPMGMGQSRMNKYNVRKATQAMANKVLKHFGGGSAVISFDSRHHSKEFAMEAAGVFAANGIKAYIFDKLSPTPMLSFGVRYLKAQCGIMITASHNPPIYNGFKAFWNDGAQVVPPIDQEIIQEYNSLRDWNLIKFMKFNEGQAKGLIEWTDNKLDEAFYEVIEKKVIQDADLCKKMGHQLSIIFTALHGSAELPCTTIAKKLGFSNFYSIPEQANPDGNFSTVKSPNPEDPRAMEMAISQMKKTQADIVFGTDPDGDRLGVVINHHGETVILNGNQIGALMIYYLFSRKDEMRILPKNSLVIKSIVTSPLQDAIVESFGGKVLSTLTGFKWMAGLIKKLEDERSPYEFVFASEESFGYMPHCESRDKDGVSSMALMSEAALYYKLKGMTLVDVLNEVYSKFGFYYESLLSLDYEGVHGAQKIKRIMEFFRSYTLSEFAGEEIVIKEDYLSRIATQVKENTTRIIELPKSDVLSFTFKSGNKLFLRPSGTEPKIKFYTMIREIEENLENKKINASNRVKSIEKEILNFCEKA